MTWPSTGPGQRLRSYVTACTYCDDDDGEHGKDACPWPGQAASARVGTSRSVSRRLLRSADANEFVAGNAEFNEYFITAEILTSSKPETSLI